MNVDASGRDAALSQAGFRGQRQLPARGRWPDDVALWHVHVPAGPHAWARLAPSLAPDERDRALRYRRDEDRLRFAATRAALRAQLGNVTGIPPLDLRFGHEPHGRPMLDGHPHLSFNVSHAGSHALIAISAARRVGVDIELLDPTLDWQPLVGLVCSDDEGVALARCNEESLRRAAFLRCWTAKEALLKALGLGIAEALRDLSVDPFSSGTQRPRVSADSVAQGVGALRFEWLDDIEGCAGCIAFSDDDGPVSRSQPVGQSARQDSAA
ncbi:4'-phosphopantetheinyl transferase family protein [Paraburkholderia phosphatilytica]|uniref:4'-phosphopantetheinyl transferase family protein n=1 Tax=Paraburkholderia phosphatilytica TaxID=2282883 RepID=UPI000E4F173F|nr:4'-phosphopantetheinyl transferase superfamily protein [Paraburkholderia phosphatilytica]